MKTHEQRRNALIAARCYLGYSQHDMAEMLGITQQCYSKYERGASNPRYKMMERIAEVLQRSISVLFADLFIPFNTVLHLTNKQSLPR